MALFSRSRIRLLILILVIALAASSARNGRVEQLCKWAGVVGTDGTDAKSSKPDQKEDTLRKPDQNCPPKTELTVEATAPKPGPERKRRRPQLHVVSFTDGRLAPHTHPHASLCNSLKGWVANNVHGTLIWGNDPKVGWTGPAEPDENEGRPGFSNPKLPDRHPIEYHVTTGKWLHTVTHVSRVSPTDDLVLLVDAFDAYFQLTPEEILDRYFEEIDTLAAVPKAVERTLRVSERELLLVSAEAWCSPWSWWPPWPGQTESKGLALCNLFKGKKWPQDFGFREGTGFGDAEDLSKQGRRLEESAGTRKLQKRAIADDDRSIKSSSPGSKKKEANEFFRPTDAPANDEDDNSWAGAFVRTDKPVPIPKVDNDFPPLPPRPDPSILSARFPNTGVLLGPPSLLLRFMAVFMYVSPYIDLMRHGPGDPIDDQALASWLLLNATKYNLQTQLDHGSRIAYSAHGVWDAEMELREGWWTHKTTGSVPVILHFNGDGKNSPRLEKALAGMWWSNYTLEDVVGAQKKGSGYWRGSVRIEGRRRRRLKEICPEVWEMQKGNLKDRVDRDRKKMKS